MKLINYNEENSIIEYEQVLSEEKLPIKIVEINIASADNECQVPKHWHRSIEIIIPKSGGTEVWVEGEVFKIKTDDFFIINSKEIHACRSLNPSKPYDGYAIQIKYDFIKECFNHADGYVLDRLIDGEDKKKLLSIFNDIIDLNHSDDPFKFLSIKSLLYQLMHELATNHSHLKERCFTIQSGKQKERLVEVLTYLDQNADEVFDATEIAEHFHLSYGYIANLFKNYLNMSMKEYVDSVRIRKAERDLLMTDMSVLEIALAHGFPNTKSFYREFKKYNQKTPNEYRKCEKMTHFTSFKAL